jgi:hypothetical protein
MKDVTYGQFVWHSATRKRRVQQKMIHSRRRQDQLSRCRGHPNSRNVGGQDALQQRHINERSKILTYPWSVFLDYRGDHHQIQTQKATKNGAFTLEQIEEYTDYHSQDYWQTSC